MIRIYRNARTVTGFAFLLLACALLQDAAVAQVAGATLSGVVTDQSGAVVPNAKIVVRNQATGLTREILSNAEGFYTAPNLLPGIYDVTVGGTGFANVTQTGIKLNVGADQSLNVTLGLQGVAQNVEVTGLAPNVQTTSSSVTATVESATIRELPLNGRDWTSLATLEPGIISIPTQVGTAFNANKGNRGFGNQLTDSGHRPYENSYRVNGINVNDYTNGAPGGATGVNLGVDAIQEFSVISTNYTAEYGRTSGAVINAITKSGSNQVHGTAYFFDRDKIFDAKNFFDDPNKPIPSFRRVQFGASGGGPIVKDRTFVYGDYEGIRQNQPIAAVIRVPSDASRAKAVPAVQPYLALWPAAPAGTPDVNGVQSFSTSRPTIANENYYTVRVDHKITDKDSLASSYFWDSGPLRQPDPLQNASHQVFSRRQMFSIEETHIFGPQLVNTFRAGVSRVIGDINDPISGNAIATNAALAIAPGAKATPQLAVTGLTTAIGLGGLNLFQYRWTSPQVNDDAFITRGSHQIRVGFAFERMRDDMLERLSPNGSMKFSLAQFLANTPRQLNALAPGTSHPVRIRESLFGVYLHDDWRFRQNLTLNMGLRYEMTTVPTEATGQFQNITTLANCTSSPTACTPVAVDSPLSRNPTLKNFEPRVGFAWDPFNNGKTAIRGGFGLFDVLPLPYIFALNDAATAPFQIIGADPTAQLGTPSGNKVSFNPSRVRNRFIDPSPSRGYTMNWNVNVQREFAQGWTAFAGYVASRSLHLPISADDINLVQPTLTSSGLLFPCVVANLGPGSGCWNTTTGTRLDPNAGGTAGIRPVLFDGAASYESFQAKLSKALTHGIQGQLSYTLGNCMDRGSNAHTGDPYLNTIAVPILGSKLYRVGACDFDIRHTLIGTFIWNVPGPPSASGLVGVLTKGWEAGTILTATSGAPFTPTLGGGGDPLGTGFNGDFSMDFVNLASGCDPIHGGVNYLNLNCFSLPQSNSSIAAQCQPFGFLTPSAANPAGSPGIAGTCSNLVGNAGRNSLYGPHLTTVDFSLFKNTHIPRISETFNVQFRAEFFNLLNHPNFGAPGFLNTAGQNNSIFDANGALLARAGALNSTSTSSRQIQLGLKLVW